MTQKIKKGFTLIELMIVVAIIGILAAIAIPNFVKFQAKTKQKEADTQLKAIFTAQKSNFPMLNGYWSDIAEIGYAPERGNRYVYDLGAVATSVAAGTEVACAQFLDRSNAAGLPAAGTCGVEADVDRHGATFAQATLFGLMGAGNLPAMFIPAGTNMALTNVGVNGAQCPSCDFAARAYSNIDNDATADLAWISSQTLETAAVAGCSQAMTVALGNAYTPGNPAPVVDDVCAEL